MKSFNLFRGRVLIGLFPYWLGVGTHITRPYLVIDAGFVKLMAVMKGYWTTA